MNLSEYFRDIPKAALAFSGGADSAYLLWSAKTNHCDLHAYYVQSVFQPAFERSDALRMAAEFGVPLTILEADVLACPQVCQNACDRCYHCKHTLFSLLWEAARRDGYPILFDGTNASDDSKDRPGMRALKELGVCSPLRDCGLTKSEIRRQSQEAGLFTWDKPAYACLATRIPTGTPYSPDLLHRVEAAEQALFALGFRDLRVRVFHGAAQIQLSADQLSQAVALGPDLINAVEPWFCPVLLDLKPR